jgi:hypothetical protein
MIFNTQVYSDFTSVVSGLRGTEFVYYFTNIDVSGSVFYATAVVSGGDNSVVLTIGNATQIPPTFFTDFPGAVRMQGFPSVS